MYNEEKIIKIIGVISAVSLVSFIGLSTITYFNNSKNLIHVSGTSNKDISNQIAEFTVTFTSQNPDKGKAESENNKKVNKFIDDVKKFPIEDKDVTTDNLNVYQNQDGYYDDKGVYKTRLGDWVYQQSIRIKIRDTKKVNDFVNLAGRNSTSNIYGPNFTVDTSSLNETEIYQAAFEDAKQKAEGIASKSGRKLGKPVSISESQLQISPIGVTARSGFQGGGGGGGAELPSGSTNVSKSLNVIFELN